MIILILLVFVSLIIAVAFLLLFFWNVKSGQYDDMYTPSVRILFDKAPEDVAKQKIKTDEEAANAEQLMK